MQHDDINHCTAENVQGGKGKMLSDQQQAIRLKKTLSDL